MNLVCLSGRLQAGAQLFTKGPAPLAFFTVSDEQKDPNLVPCRLYGALALVHAPELTAGARVLVRGELERPASCPALFVVRVLELELITLDKA